MLGISRPTYSLKHCRLNNKTKPKQWEEMQ